MILNFNLAFALRELELESLLTANHYVYEDLFRDNGLYWLDSGNHSAAVVGETKTDVIYFLKQELKRMGENPL